MTKITATKQNNSVEAIMAQVMNFETVTSDDVLNQKTYAVSFKGLIAHFMDILFIRSKSVKEYNVSDLPVHLQKDIGLYR